MNDRRMHLAWFLRNGWGDFVRSLERACFDYLIIEDSSYVPDGSKQVPGRRC